MKSVSKRICLVIENLSLEFWSWKFEGYDRAVFEKSKALEDFVAFIDGTVIGISRPGGVEICQRIVYNGHKREHAIMFQAVTSPSGLPMHLAGPIEGRRHDWTM